MTIVGLTSGLSGPAIFGMAMHSAAAPAAQPQRSPHRRTVHDGRNRDRLS